MSGPREDRLIAGRRFQAVTELGGFVHRVDGKPVSERVYLNLRAVAVKRSTRRLADVINIR